MSPTKRCSKCGGVFPLNRNNFGGGGSKGWNSRCRSCMRANSRAWAAKNPAKARAKEEKRQKLNDGFVITFELRSRLRTEQGGLCALCGGTVETMSDCSVDHLIPLARGGSHHETNLVAAHTGCNQEKHGKTLRGYVRWRKQVGLPASTFINDKIRKALQ